MGLILADTNVIIYLLEGDHALGQFFDAHKISISFITELELLTAKKYKAAEEKSIHQFLEKCITYSYNDLIKSHCIDIRLKYSLKLPDAIIAATAKAYNIPLFTADKNFSKISEIGVSIYSF